MMQFRKISGVFISLLAEVPVKKPTGGMLDRMCWGKAKHGEEYNNILGIMSKSVQVRPCS